MEWNENIKIQSLFIQEHIKKMHNALEIEVLDGLYNTALLLKVNIEILLNAEKKITVP